MEYKYGNDTLTIPELSIRILIFLEFLLFLSSQIDIFTIILYYVNFHIILIMWLNAHKIRFILLSSKVNNST